MLNVGEKVIHILTGFKYTVVSVGEDNLGRWYHVKDSEGNTHVKGDTFEQWIVILNPEHGRRTHI